MAFSRGQEMKDATAVQTEGGRKTHLAAITNAGGIYADTLCGERVAHGDPDADLSDVCASCRDTYADAFPDGNLSTVQRSASRATRAAEPATVEKTAQPAPAGRPAE